MEQTSVNSVNRGYKMSFKKIMRAAIAEIRVHKKTAIITLVLFGASMLMYILNSNLYVSNYSNANYSQSNWGQFFTISGIIAGFAAALSVFRDMNDQQICDVSMALPIKATERYFSKLICLFFIQVVPLIVSYLGGNGIEILFRYINKGTMPSNGSVVFEYSMLFLSLSMFIMAISVLCSCCCGSKAESSYFSIISMFIVTALPWSFVYNIVSNSSGFKNLNFWGERLDICWWGFLPAFTGNKLIPHSLVSIAISLVVMLLSWFIYKKRDARSVGTPIYSRVFFEIIMLLGCFTVFSFFSFSSTTIWGYVLAGVAFVIINIIVCRAKINALSFLKWAGKFLAIAAVSLGIMVVSVKTGGFGNATARPATEYLYGAKFSIYCGNGYFSDDKIINLQTNSLTAEQAEEMLTICQKHVKNGIAKTNPLCTIFDIYQSDAPYVTICAESDIEYDFQPYPKSQFEICYDYVHTNNNDRGKPRTYYTFNYAQEIQMPVSEINEMVSELKGLDYVTTIDNDNNNQYPETEPETVSADDEEI